MGLMAMFRREPASGETPKAKRAGRGGKAVDQEATVQRLRQQARRRLLGAAVLVGIGIVAFPIVFETQPRPVPMDLPIVIPAKDKVEPPRVSVASAELPAGLPEAARVEPVAEPVAEPTSEAAAPAAPIAAKPPAEKTAEKAVEKPADKTPAAKPAADGARYVVQVGAFADKNAAQTARKKLEAKGLKTYAQVAKTKDGDRIRVRLGPFADRAEAEKAAARAKAIGLAGAVLTL
jgi:DedD protein